MTQNLDVCVCTYRRPQLVETLASLMALNSPTGYTVSVLVVDNDDQPSARNTVEAFAATSSLPVRYEHCPQGNISIARNGALTHSSARFLAFIDDDEVASPDWLVHLVQVMESSTADVVLGPVMSVYADAAPVWMRRTGIHDTKPVWVNGAIRTGYTCNVLFDRQSAALQGREFDVELGQTGGEDTTFFARIVADGGCIAYAPQANVCEDVPADRATFGWLLRRRYRMGQTHGRLVAEAGGTILRIAVTFCKVVYCAVAAAVQGFSADRRNKAILRGALHVGTLSGLMGGTMLQQYGSQFTKRQSE